MKKFVKIIAVALVLVTFAGLLASCGKTLNGTYVMKATDIDLGDLGSNKTTLKFSGNKITVTTTTVVFGQESTTTQEGTYKLEKGEDGNWKITTTYKEDGKEQTASVPFEELDNGDIKIAGTTYTKEK